ncbi:MAG: M50 family metallopeptidase [Actinomycetota bacterium]
MLVGIIGFVVILVLVIMIHEAGHFLVAKRFGMKIEEYFLGFGPKIWSFRRGETEYGVKAIIVGGYVKIAGMNPYETPKAEDLPRTYGAKSMWKRALVILAGPVSHFVLAFLALWVYLGFIGAPTDFTTQITGVVAQLDGADSPAHQSGLLPGDEVLAIDGTRLAPDAVVDYTRAHVGEPINLTIEREGQTEVITVTPVLSEVDGEQVGRLGVSLGPGSVVARDPAGVVGGAREAAVGVADATGLIVREIGRVFGPEGIGRLGKLVFTDTQRAQTDPVSLVGAAQASGAFTQQGNLDRLILLFVSFNIFIGLMNLLPLPPFDGGHLAVLVIEKVRKKPVDMRKLIPVSAVVLALFTLFGLTVMYLDIFKPVSFAP